MLTTSSVGQTGHVAPTIEHGDVDLDAVIVALREAGATFALLHGSRMDGTARAGSDLDVAAWLPPDVEAWTVPVPDQVDLSHLRRLPLHIAGRIAQHGVLLFDDDAPARVRWQADTRLRWADEAHRRRWITADALEAARG